MSDAPSEHVEPSLNAPSTDGTAARSEVTKLAERLARLDAAAPADRRETRALRASLRLRLAELRDRELGDPASAVDTLLPACAECGAVAALAHPLAALLARLARYSALADLACDAARITSDPYERADWWRRCAAARSAAGDDEAATDAWRAALALVPHDRVAWLALFATLARRGNWEDARRCLDERLSRASAGESVVLRLALARVLGGPLARPIDARIERQRANRLAALLPDDEPSARAMLPLLATLDMSLDASRDESEGECAAALARRVHALSQTGDASRRASAAEAELRALAGGPSILDLRRRTLHASLATLYADVFDDPDAAIAHARAHLALIPLGAQAAREESEAVLIAQLERGGGTLELEARLAIAAESRDAPGSRALRRLARLRERTLHDLAGAGAAWRALLEREPDDAEARRALRGLARRLADAPTLAALLEHELARPPRERENASPGQHAALWSELGFVLRDALQATPRAMRAFAAAVEADPGCTEALHALQASLVAVEDWKGAAELVRSELDLVPDDAHALRRQLWLRIARLARLADADDPLAAEAFAEARALGAAQWDPDDDEVEDALRPPARSASRDGPLRAEPTQAADERADVPGALPVSPHGAHQRARVAVSEGRFDEALGWIAHAVTTTREPAWRARLRADEAAIRAGACADPAGARDALREAVALRPADPALRGALADLLARDPATREDATRRHRELLQHDPTRLASIEALTAIAAAEGRSALAEDGRVIASLLRGEDAGRLQTAIGIETTLEHPLWDRLRRALAEVAGPLDRALAFAMRPLAVLPLDPLARFRELSLRAEAELTASSLVALEDEAFGVVVGLVAALAFAREVVTGDANLVNRLADALRWRERRAIRAALSPFDASEAVEVTVPAFREELRAIAHAMAVDRSDGDIAAALRALMRDDGVSLREDEPLRAGVARSPAARALLRRVCAAWSATL